MKAMSRKTKRTAQTEEAVRTLVPKLRFPEFRKAAGWKCESMSKVYSFKGNNSLSRDKLNYASGSVKNIHYGDIHTKFSTHFDITKELVPFINDSELGLIRDENFCTEGDIVFADASEDLDDIGKSIEIVNLNNERVVSGTHTILARQTDDHLVLGFAGHLFKSGWVRAQIQKESQGSKVLGISPTRLRDTPLPFPPEKAEQQKIASCLSSLDEVIAAQARKLDALKTHKKGLMQQLFPSEGETQPRFRFPEFQHAGEWEEKSLDQLVNIQSGGTPSKANSAFWNGSIPWVSAKDMKKLFLEDAEDHISADAVDDGARLVPPGTLLMLVRGMTLLKDVPICVVRRQMSFNQDVKALRPIDGVDSLFLAFLLVGCKDRLLEMVTVAGHGTGKLDTDELKAMALMLPSPAEQQRIATCLNTLDDLTATETQKLETLKTHKRGLMQQLFPSPEEVEA